MYVLPPLPRCGAWASSSLISPSRISLPRKGHRVGPHIGIFEACSAFTRVAARTLAPSPKCDLLHRRLQPFRHLHDCSGCFRLERFAGWDLHPLESAAFHGAHPLLPFPVALVRQERATNGRAAWTGLDPVSTYGDSQSSLRQLTHSGLLSPSGRAGGSVAAGGNLNATRLVGPPSLGVDLCGRRRADSDRGRIPEFSSAAGLASIGLS